MPAKQQPTPPRLLSLKDAASYLGGIGRTKLNELVASGQIQSMRVGRRRLIPVDCLERFIAEQLEDGGSS